ncbi:NAD-dependent succinate-semialdehyde dehydrogenase [Naumannella halotolerans]|uniref:NAD-dependent succinate-semialdehyde dehydrogenase n=1 Tax=Naumannella halotolerans TaxID=993414 RepID=UPI00370D7A5A
MTTPAAVSKLNTDLFIDGQWVPARSGATFDVVNPATEEVLAVVADGAAADATAALDAAVAVQAEWAATAPRERGEILRRAFELITERADEIASIMTAEMGKPLAEAKGEVAYGAEFFRWFSEEAVRISGDQLLAPDGKTRYFVQRQPVGPCVLVTPWNFPLAMGTRKIGPAVAAGCTMVFKPAELTPLTSLALVEILAEAGLPDGVLNVVNTTDPGEVVTAWMTDPRARKVSFTGSTPVGKHLLKQAADNVMRTSMELGGNAPFLVFDDADLDVAIGGAMAAKMRNMGEACVAANRIYVQSGVAEEFSNRLAEKMGALTVGDGATEGVGVGPLIEQKALDKVVQLVDDAVEGGAEVKVGGDRPAGDGFFYNPTVLSNVSSESDLMSTEIFGPVAAVVPFDTEEEAIALANATPFGLAGYLFTTDLNRAFRVSDAMEVGMVGLNTGIVSNPAAPFGGIKQSGLGREGGSEGIDEFLEVKLIAMPQP